MTTITATTTSPVTASYTNYKGEWMIRTNRQLTKEDRSLESRPVLGGGQELIEVCYVEVTLKSGATKTVEVLEYETKFASKNGLPEAHIYSVR